MGFILALALSIDNLLIGFGIGANIGNNLYKLLSISIILGFAVILGTFIGIKSVKKLNNTSYLDFIIAFGVVALMWETFQELMPETKIINNPYNLFGMYFGFLLVFIINWIV